jgi:O-antigen ligase
MQLFTEHAHVWQRLSGIFLLLFAATLPHSIAASQIAAGGVTFFWILQLVGARRWRRRTPFDFPILCFLVISVLAAVFSLAPAVSVSKLRGTALVLLVLIVADSIRTRRQALLLVSVLLGSASLGAMATWWQKAVGDGVAIVSLTPDSPLRQAGVNPTDIILACNDQRLRQPEQLSQVLRDASGKQALRCQALVAGQDLYEFTLPVQKWKAAVPRQQFGYTATIGRYARARGTYSHYTTYSEVLLQLTALAIGLWFVCPRKWRGPGGLLAVVPIVLAGALAATLTRGSWAGLVAGLLAMLWVRLGWRGRVLSLLAAVLVLGGANLMLKQWRGSGFYNPADPGDQYRLLMWSDGVRLIGEYPWLGIGMDTVRVHWRELGIRAYEKFPLHSHFHSTPVQLGVERGLLGLAAWLWLMAVYLAVLIRLLRRYRDDDWAVYGLILGIFGGACGFLLSGVVHYNLGDSEVAMVLWLLAGVALALKQIGEEGPSSNPMGVS